MELQRCLEHLSGSRSQISKCSESSRLVWTKGHSYLDKTLDSSVKNLCSGSTAALPSLTPCGVLGQLDSHEAQR